MHLFFIHYIDKINIWILLRNVLLYHSQMTESIVQIQTLESGHGIMDYTTIIFILVVQAQQAMEH